jgi:DNA topoisomerase I
VASVASDNEKPAGHKIRLVFCETDTLTITRRRIGGAWAYFDAAKRRLTDADEVSRLNALALPPAYQDARFNPDPDGHLLAVGLDARGRRQYRYHAAFRAAQDAQKFSLCAEFGQALPRLRQRLVRDMAAPPASRDAVLAAMVRILDTAYLRIGNEAYFRSNKSVGLTSLRQRHARPRGRALELRYRGKAGIMRSVRLNDRSLLRIMRRCQDLPGQRLFQYVDEDGAVRALGSADVNAYLRDHLGSDFTAKHFRTWHASVHAFDALWQGQSLSEALAHVADKLGNTPAIARKSYVHPALLEMPGAALRAIALPRQMRWLTRYERGFLATLEDISTTDKEAGT